MKKLNIIYWVFTTLFAGLMLLSSIPDIILSPDAVVFMHHLGYPDYFTIFIGVAKILGVIAIVVPGFPRLKEWAYAGMFFDLIGAVYSQLATDGFMPLMLFMILPIFLGAMSYIYYHERLSAKA